MKSLCQKLKALTRNKKILFVGVGNTLKGDDAAGIQLMERLSRLNSANNGRLKFLNCGMSPENYLEKIKEFNPEVVVFVDAATMGKLPGSLTLVDLEKLNDFSLSTHSLSLVYLKEYLKSLKCQFFLLGIQPKVCALDTGLSREVLASIDVFVTDFKF